ncbi:MAG: hypothetical protein K9K88_07740 [Desulfobacterales bacterium]|nr:hypothetical protein [Desulfobacterales bacterium]
MDLVPVLFPPKNLKNIGAYTSVLVRFEEGFKRFGIFAGAPEKLSIGDPVRIESFNGDTQELFLTNG